MERLRHAVFWPALLLLGAGLVYTIPGGEEAVKLLTKQAFAAVDLMRLPLSYLAFLSVVICIFVAASPLGGVRIGGKDAEPLLTKWQYFSIALCTTVAVGILFWATAEPLYHYESPPESLGIAAQSQGAKVFAMSTLMQHWTFIPYSLYAVPSVLFALAFYNMGRPFRLSSCLYPIMGKWSDGPVGVIVDTTCLFALVAGMAASLGAGILTLGGGLQHSFGLPSSKPVWAVIGFVVVACFIISAVSGLEKGIRILSDFNAKVFFVMMAVIALMGPGGDRIAVTLAGVGDYLGSLVPRTLLWEFKPGDGWPVAWPLFYWSNWLAWAPVTALFLGRISKGYTVRQMLLFLLVLPSTFVIVWMGVLGGSALDMESKTQALLPKLKSDGPESVIYSIFDVMPMGGILATVFILGVFISYVTAADSNTLAMAGLCWKGVSAEDPEPPTWLKILWGCIVGTVAVVMICSAGIDGVKALSNFGGIPAFFFEVGCALSLLLYVRKTWEFEDFSGDNEDE